MIIVSCKRLSRWPFSFLHLFFFFLSFLCDSVSISSVHHHKHTHITTHTESTRDQVSVITVFSGWWCLYLPEEFTPPWTSLCRALLTVGVGKEGRGGSCAACGRRRRRESTWRKRNSQFLWVRLAVGHRMRAVAFLSVWEETAIFPHFLFFFCLENFSLLAEDLRKRKTADDSVFVSSFLKLLIHWSGFIIFCNASSWCSFQAKATLCGGHQAGAHSPPHPQCCQSSYLAEPHDPAAGTQGKWRGSGTQLPAVSQVPVPAGEDARRQVQIRGEQDLQGEWRWTLVVHQFDGSVFVRSCDTTCVRDERAGGVWIGRLALFDTALPSVPSWFEQVFIFL